MMALDDLWRSAPSFISGFWLTLQLTAIPLLAGLAFAIPLSVMRISPQRMWWTPVAFFTYVMRGTPMLAQLMIVYYGFGQMQWLQQMWAQGHPVWLLLRDPYYCALLAFTLNTCAYTTEILAGALRGIPSGEVEAALAVGMSKSMALRRVLLPSALRRSLPAYGNEVILMLQGTSIASAVTLIDLTGAARDLYANFYAPFEAFVAAGTVYLALSMGLTWLFRRLEQRYMRFLQPRSSLSH